MPKGKKLHRQNPDDGADKQIVPPVDLESLLEAVLERDGAVLSVAPHPRKRAEKKSEPIFTSSGPDASPAFVTQSAIPPEEAPMTGDAVRELDRAMLYRIDPLAKSRQPKHIPIRFMPHEASGYVLKMEGSAQKTVREDREAFGGTINHWASPYEAPPDLNVILYDAKDLEVEEIEPRRFIEQFTPADPDVAYAVQYHWWSKWRSPFIRWEMASNAKELRRRLQLDVENVMDAALYLDDQFTPANAEQAYQEQFGARNRMRDWLANWKDEPAETFEQMMEKEAEEEEEEEIVSLPVTASRVEPVEPASSWEVPMVVPRLDIGRVMVGFMALALIVTIPAIGVTVTHSVRTSAGLVASDSQAALDEMRSAITSRSLTQQEPWNQASNRFQSAERDLANINKLALAAASAVPQTRHLYQSASALLQAGDKSSQAAAILSEGMQKALEDSVRHPDERLLSLGASLDAATPLLEDAVSAVSRVDENGLPENIRTKVSTLKDALTLGQTTLRDLRVLDGLLVDAVGHDHMRRYLFVFQNHTELRPTGGFMGSMAEVTVNQGEITNLFVPGGGPYDFESQLTARVVPPAPLRLIDARWEFQDANWFPDFPTAAKKIRWFWSKSGQPTLDGVIAVNATLLEKMLAITGPIDMPEYGKVITADNVMLETQKAVELEYDKKENKPKKFVGDLLAKVLDRLKSGTSEQRLGLITMFADALETKDIQVALTDPDEDAIAQAFGWSGRIAPALGDALAVIEANIAGQKTDGVIDEHVRHDVAIASDGSITDTLTLTRTHNGQKGELFQGANNVEYLRIYVPKGSQLIAADGFYPPDPSQFSVPDTSNATDTDIAALVKTVPSPIPDVDVTEEFDRTAFGGWIQLRPGQTSTTHFEYRLPFTVSDLARNAGKEGFETSPNQAAYVLQLTSQSGKPNRDIETHLSVPSSWRTSWSKQDDGLKSTADNGLAGTWDRDYVIANVFDTSNDAQRTAAAR